jgi:hypothetical protein
LPPPRHFLGGGVVHAPRGGGVAPQQILMSVRGSW